MKQTFWLVNWNYNTSIGEVIAKGWYSCDFNFTTSPFSSFHQGKYSVRPSKGLGPSHSPRRHAPKYLQERNHCRLLQCNKFLRGKKEIASRPSRVITFSYRALTSPYCFLISWFCGSNLEANSASVLLPLH